MFKIFWSDEAQMWRAEFVTAPNHIYGEADSPQEALENLIFELEKNDFPWLEEGVCG